MYDTTLLNIRASVIGARLGTLRVCRTCRKDAGQLFWGLAKPFQKQPRLITSFVSIISLIVSALRKNMTQTLVTPTSELQSIQPTRLPPL
jgi:hypothetical protein